VFNSVSVISGQDEKLLASQEISGLVAFHLAQTTIHLEAKQLLFATHTHGTNGNETCKGVAIQ
jgi:hypothetical protein